MALAVLCFVPVLLLSLRRVLGRVGPEGLQREATAMAGQEGSTKFRPLGPGRSKKKTTNESDHSGSLLPPWRVF